MSARQRKTVLAPESPGASTLATAATPLAATAATIAPSACRFHSRVGEYAAGAHWKRSIIEAALVHPKGSRERGEAIDSIARQTHATLGGGSRTFTPQTIRDWVRTIEADGGALSGVIRKPRAQETAPRYLIGRKWDRSCPLPSAEKREIEQKIRRYVRSLWADRPNSRKKIQSLAATKLLELSLAAGWHEARLEPCRPSAYFIDSESEYRLIAIKERDAKRFSDLHTPRIQRERPKKPMDVVVGDVHHVDILVQRADGSTATPKMIAWYDWATGDIFYTLVLLEPGKGITQAHVARSFVEMVLAWGLPRALYLDNGKEFDWKEMIDGFRTIIALDKAFEFEFEIGDGIDSDDSGNPESYEPRDPIVRAKPYHPQSKIIESAFAILERFLKLIDGYIGGDRFNKPVHKLGAQPRPYPGTFDQLVRTDFADAVEFYRNDCKVDGKTVNDHKRAHIEAGFRRAIPEYEVFLYAFSTQKTYKVQPGGINIGEEWYYGDELLPLIQQRVEVRYAKWDDRFILLIRGGERPLAISKASKHCALGRSGAKEQSRRSGLLHQHVQEMGCAVDKISTMGEVRRHIAAFPPAPVAPRGAVISLSPECSAFDEVAKEAAKLPVPPNVALQPGQVFNDKTGEVIDLIPTAPAVPRASNTLDYNALLGIPPPQRNRPDAFANASGLDSSAPNPLARKAKEPEKS